MKSLAMDQKVPRTVLGGILMGKPLVLFFKGAFGPIFRCKDYHLLVNQLADETNGDSELIDEYHRPVFRGKCMETLLTKKEFWSMFLQCNEFILCSIVTVTGATLQ